MNLELQSRRTALNNVRSILLLLLLTVSSFVMAQNTEPFTFKFETNKYSNIDTKSYICEQNNEKEGVKIKFLESVGDLSALTQGGMGELFSVFYTIKLNLSYAKHDYIVDRHQNVAFPTNQYIKALMAFSLDNGTMVRKHITVERSGQYITIETNPPDFYDTKKGDIEADDFLSLIVQHNITEIKLGCYIEDAELASQGFANTPNNFWTWQLNSFKTAPMITAMFQRIAQEEDKKSSAGSNSNNGGTAKVGWRTHLRKTLDHATINFSSGSKYKGQTSIEDGIQRFQGIGLLWYYSDYIYCGGFVNGSLMGYAIDIAADGKNVDNCPNCLYYVGYYCDGLKCGKGRCYDKDGKMIYYGDFSNNRPIGTYPTKENYSSYKFECIEYTSGDKYLGETYNGKQQGQGFYLWNNGDAWYGPWKDGIRDGYGIMMYYNGNVKYGKWSNNDYYKN